MAALQIIFTVVVISFSRCYGETTPSLSVNSEHSVQNQDQALLISQLNVKLEELHSRIAEQDVKIAQQETMLAEINTEICQLKHGSTITSENLEIGVYGVVFTRWGRTDCPVNISTAVYSGIAGGSWYSNTGGVAEYVCLAPDPLWSIDKHFTGINPQNIPSLYGAEYDDMPNSNLNQYTAPCTVCRATNFSTMIMIPGRNKCYPGWTEAYHGNLGSGPTLYKSASQYICVDMNSQRIGTPADDNGKHIYTVKAACGSLPCPPYQDGKILSCVVCLK